MKDTKRCAHCRRMLAPTRIKNQRYCKQTACQRARKARWQRQKMATDADYQANQTDAYEHWCQHNPDYWRKYRDRNPDYVKRNRRLQTQRNAKRQRIAKMDAKKPFLSFNSGTYYIFISYPHRLARLQKRTSMLKKFTLFQPLSYTYRLIAKMDLMDRVPHLLYKG